MEMEQALNQLDVLFEARFECESVLEALNNNPTSMVLMASQMRLERAAAMTGLTYRQESGEMSKEARLKYRAEGILQAIANLISRLINAIKSLFTRSSSSSSSSSGPSEEKKQDAEALKAKAAVDTDVELNKSITNCVGVEKEGDKYYIIPPTILTAGDVFKKSTELIKDATRTLGVMTSSVRKMANGDTSIRVTDVTDLHENKIKTLETFYRNIGGFLSRGFEFRDPDNVIVAIGVTDWEVAAISWNGSGFSSEFVKIEKPEFSQVWATPKVFEQHLDNQVKMLEASADYMRENFSPPKVLNEAEKLLGDLQKTKVDTVVLRCLGHQLNLLKMSISIGEHALKVFQPYTKLFWVPKQSSADDILRDIDDPNVKEIVI